MILFAFLLSWLVGQAAAVESWPCSQQVTADGNGGEIWKCPSPEATSPVITHIVRDYGDALRPTLVYNCKYVPALCNNVKAFLGVTGPTASKLGLHYDRITKRVDMRRESVCPSGSGWINQQVNGRNRCPEPDQPATWRYRKCTKDDGKGRCVTWTDDDGPQETVMYQKTDSTTGTVTIDKSRLAKRGIPNYEQDNTRTETYIQLGAQMSCDEWPAASWIEGGNGDIKSSNTYCAPISSPCGKRKKTALDTEQNWQASGHQALRNWFAKQAGGLAYLSDQTQFYLENYSIFKFDFRMETEDDTPAVYLEANGQKRYCYGLQGDGVKCDKNNTDDPDPVNPPDPENPQEP